MSVAADVPRVTGRHRNHALAAAHQARAVQLVTEGKTYQHVADQLGYANRGTVHRLVARALARTTMESVEELRRLEGERLDALLHSVWDHAMSGDLAAVNAAARIVSAQAKLYGLTGKWESVKPALPRTVVVPPEELALGI